MNVTQPASTGTIPLTCIRDGRCHLVSDEQMAAGRQARTGRYVALCGHTVTAASMVDPDGRPCTDCATHTAPPSRRHRARRLGGHRHRQPGLLRLLLTRALVPTTPAVPLSRPPARLPGRDGRAPTAAGPESTPTSSGPAASQPTRAVS